jgi:hypothetical protein
MLHVVTQGKTNHIQLGRQGGSLLTGVKTQQCYGEAFSHGRTPARVATSGTSNRLSPLWQLSLSYGLLTRRLQRSVPACILFASSQQVLQAILWPTQFDKENKRRHMRP